jgi:proline iminopeptidase
MGALTTRRRAPAARGTVPVAPQRSVPVRRGMRTTVRGDWRRGSAVLVAAVAAFALLSGWLTPRGPVTAAQALTAMAAAAAVGLLAGAATGRRWALLVAPAVFIVVFELTRVSAVGPTVDLVQANTLVSWMAFLLGRVFHGLLVVVPMMVGGAYGVEVAARRGRAGAPRLGRPGWTGLVVATLGVVVLGVLVARPASTAPILGADGEPLPGSVAELTTTPINGQEQALMIRGVSTDNPVLLHLAGGPGGTDIGAMRLDTSLEQHFVVATWDQPGTGKSYPAFDPDTLSLDRVVADTVEVANYLRERFGQERIYLAGQSWGTIPATLAAQRHPELFHALIGTGYMVSIRETDRIFYDDTLTWAEATGNEALAAKLRAMGPPPYDDPIADYPTLVGAERDLNPYPEFDGHTEIISTIWVPENNLVEQINALRGLSDTYAWLYPQLQTFDFRNDVPSLDVPVYVVMGRHEARGRVEPARQWFDELQAPIKRWVTFDASSHRASFERPADYTELLTEVLADTTRNS